VVRGGGHFRGLERRAFTSHDVYYFSHDSLIPAAAGERVRFTRRGQSVVFKEYLKAGSYNVRVNPQRQGVESWLCVVTRDNLEVGELELVPEARVQLPDSTKYSLRLFLAPGGELRSLEIEPVRAL
jgi:hypothetical protein